MKKQMKADSFNDNELSKSVSNWMKDPILVEHLWGKGIDPYDIGKIINNNFVNYARFLKLWYGEDHPMFSDKSRTPHIKESYVSLAFQTPKSSAFLDKWNKYMMGYFCVKNYIKKQQAQHLTNEEYQILKWFFKVKCNSSDRIADKKALETIEQYGLLKCHRVDFTEGTYKRKRYKFMISSIDGIKMLINIWKKDYDLYANQPKGCSQLKNVNVVDNIVKGIKKYPVDVQKDIALKLLKNISL